MPKLTGLLMLATLVQGCSTVSTDSRGTLCAALAEPTRLAAGAVALGEDDAAVLAVERLVRVIDGGCR
jgi:hypothetical protein